MPKRDRSPESIAESFQPRVTRFRARVNSVLAKEPQDEQEVQRVIEKGLALMQEIEDNRELLRQHGLYTLNAIDLGRAYGRLPGVWRDDEATDSAAAGSGTVQSSAGPSQPLGSEPTAKRAKKSTPPISKVKDGAEKVNDLWHLGVYTELQRWGLLVYGIVDDYSRRILAIHIASDKDESAALDTFRAALDTTQRIPAVVTTRHDKGEFDEVEEFIKSEVSPFCEFLQCDDSVNRRMRYTWRDLRRKSFILYEELFQSLEDSGHLDRTNANDMMILHRALLNYIQSSMEYISAVGKNRATATFKLPPGSGKRSKTESPEKRYLMNLRSSNKMKRWPLKAGQYKPREGVPQRLFKTGYRGDLSSPWYYPVQYIALDDTLHPFLLTEEFSAMANRVVEATFQDKPLENVKNEYVKFRAQTMKRLA